MPWQQQLLTELRLVGANANQEISLGREPLVDARLLAAVRILSATSVADLRGRSVENLGSLSEPLEAGIEVRALGA